MHKRRGFTLIELLIVIVIIGILATIATGLFWDVKDRALAKSIESDLRNLATHQETYFDQGYQYAASQADLVDFENSPGVVITITYAGVQGWAAQAIHGSYPGYTCGIFVGDAAPADGAPATAAGVIACD